MYTAVYMAMYTAVYMAVYTDCASGGVRAVNTACTIQSRVHAGVKFSGSWWELSSGS